MAIGWQQILIIGIIVLFLFGGKGKISSILGDLGAGIKAFRTGLNEEITDDTAERINDKS